MKLPEFRAKEIFKQFDIPIPKGHLATNPYDASRIARDLSKPVVLKAQVLSGSRGKAGGILFAEDPEEAKKKTRKLLSSKIRGVKV
ncbi:acetate--CoA ligase family protein, partial [Candidatus Pacearchaeota archaeon]|nr:acetate--CoA ligase family protein [Candidatus Pacearchaeota archaeon]